MIKSFNYTTYEDGINTGELVGEGDIVIELQELSKNARNDAIDECAEYVRTHIMDNSATIVVAKKGLGGKYSMTNELLAEELIKLKD